MAVIRRSLASIKGRRGTVYPREFAGPSARTDQAALTDALGLTQFGVNLTTLEPGRHVLPSPLAR